MMPTATAAALAAATEAALKDAARKVTETHPEVVARVKPEAMPKPTFEDEFAGVPRLSERLAALGYEVEPGDFDPPCNPLPVGTWSGDDAELIPSVEEFASYRPQWDVLAPFFWALHNGWRTKFDGPPGTGKTETARFAAAVLQVPFFRQNFYDGMDVDYVIGHAALVDGEKGVVTGYELGQLSRALLRGGIVLLDEPWKAPPTLWAAFAPLLERGGKLRLLGKPDHDLLTPHPTCRVVLADNAKGVGDNADKYASAQIQDISIINRIETHIEVGYMPASEEEALAASLVPGHRPHDYKHLISMVNQLRTANVKGELSFTCSMRQLIPLMQTSKHCGWKGAWALHFRNALTDDDKGLFDRLFHKVYGENF